jgi:hypothetical protein
MMPTKTKARPFQRAVVLSGWQSPDRGFDEGRFLGRNIWDRRYPVVDEERGVVLSIVRFGRQTHWMARRLRSGPRVR